MVSFEKFDQLLQEPIPELPIESIFDIGGIGKDEQIINKFYKFFLNNNNVHGLGSIFIDSLIAVANKKNINIPESWQNFMVRREVATKRQNRIDILIEEGKGTDLKAIIIEVKINARPENDFEDYYSFIKAQDGRKFGILIHDKPIAEKCEPFFKITHSEWLSEVRSRIYKAELKNFYALVALQLTDLFVKTTDNKKKIEVADKFALEHSPILSEAANTNTKELSISADKVNKASQLIDMHQSMQDRLFGGLKNSAFMLELDTYTCRRLIGGELALKFKIGRIFFRLIFILNGKNKSGIVSVYFDLLKTSEISIDEFYILYREFEKIKLIKELESKGINKSKQLESNYFTIAQKNYKEKELTCFGETSEILFNLVKKEWLPLIKFFEDKLRKMNLN